MSAKRGTTKDIQADDPHGTLDRLAEGLRRVLSASKDRIRPLAPKTAKKTRKG